MRTPLPIFAVALFTLLAATASSLWHVRGVTSSNSTHTVDATPAEQALVGLWALPEGQGRAGDPVRFYYFHEGHIGLYRYGKVGLNHTNSYDYAVVDDTVTLTYRKTGKQVALRYRIERDPNNANLDWLVVDDDPRQGGPARYQRVRGGMAQLAPDLVDDDESLAGDPIGGRLWIDAVPFKTGGMSFSLYQLNKSGIDGRGVGWHHEGDFNDWSTEALTYRTSTAALEFDFTLRNEHALTARRDAGAGRDRTLTLVEDPRSYWSRRTYKDGGPSFGSLTWSTLLTSSR